MEWHHQLYSSPLLDQKNRVWDLEGRRRRGPQVVVRVVGSFFEVCVVLVYGGPECDLLAQSGL